MTAHTSQNDKSDKAMVNQRRFLELLGQAGELAITGKRDEVFANPKLAKQYLKALQAFKEKRQIKITEGCVLSDDIRAKIAEWEELYNEDGIETDFSDLWIPPHQKGYDRLIVIPKGLKIQQAIDKCSKHFPIVQFPYQTFDEYSTENDRDSVDGNYAVWVRNEVLKNLSANDLKKRKILGITLLEHIQHIHKYSTETGKSLNKGFKTLCSGSRTYLGRVPGGTWDPEDLNGKEVLRFGSCTLEYSHSSWCAAVIVA